MDDDRSEARAVVEALAKHEEAISALYSAYGGQYPQVADLWKTLAREEFGHAKLLRGLLDEVDDLTTFIAARRFDREEIMADTRKIRNLADVTPHAGFPLQEAFRSAVKIEESLIETAVFEPSPDDSPEVGAVVATLHEQTERHRRHLSESLSQLSQA
jgi:hypothetical protein